MPSAIQAKAWSESQNRRRQGECWGKTAHAQDCFNEEVVQVVEQTTGLDSSVDDLSSMISKSTYCQVCGSG